MKIKGFESVQIHHVPAVTVNDTVKSYTTHSLGDGLWSIEAHEGNDDWSPCVMEWCGSNGTRYDEEADDLWAEVAQWEKDPEGGAKVLKPSYTYKLYIAPDGERGNYKHFIKEVLAGRLHGLLVCF